LTWGAHPDAHDLTAPIEIGTDWLLDLSTNGRKTLGKFYGCNAIARQPLMVEPSELLQVTAL
jgi:hypothetical protein